MKTSDASRRHVLNIKEKTERKKIDFAHDDTTFLMMMTSPYVVYTHKFMWQKKHLFPFIHISHIWHPLSLSLFCSITIISGWFESFQMWHTTKNHVTNTTRVCATFATQRIPCEEENLWKRRKIFVLLVLWRDSLHADTVLTLLPNCEIKKRELWRLNWIFLLFLCESWWENLIKKRCEKKKKKD